MSVKERGRERVRQRVRQTGENDRVREKKRYRNCGGNRVQA